jgi:hypothetical protein
MLGHMQHVYKRATKTLEELKSQTMKFLVPPIPEVTYVSLYAFRLINISAGKTAISIF